MKRLLPVLDLDIQIEHEGHKLGLQGSGREFVAKFESLRALVHFGLRAWPFRKLAPSSCRLQVEWKGRRFPR
jgi:hypothetical protein